MADEGEILPPQPQPPDARARGGDALIPQPHGGALRPPFGPGNGVGQGASAKGVSMRKVRKEARALYSEFSTEAVQRHIELCRHENPMFALPALREFYDRFMGKANEFGLGRDEDGTPIDLTKYPKETQDEIMHLLARLTELTGVGAGEE